MFDCAQFSMDDCSTDYETGFSHGLIELGKHNAKWINAIHCQYQADQSLPNSEQFIIDMNTPSKYVNP